MWKTDAPNCHAWCRFTIRSIKLDGSPLLPDQALDFLLSRSFSLQLAVPLSFILVPSPSCAAFQPGLGNGHSVSVFLVLLGLPLPEPGSSELESGSEALGR